MMESLFHKVCLNTDEEIIQRVVEGDATLFEILVRRYNAVLYRIARSYDFNHQDAEDLLQDTHVAAYEHLAQFSGRASYKTWLSKIMINKCLYKLKYGYHRNETPAELKEPHQPVHTKEKGSQPDERVLNKELSLILEASLRRLSPNYRTVFILREVEGFSVAETAELLQLTSVNVKVRLNRAKSLLQKEIEQFYNRSEIYSFTLIYCDAVVQKVFARINPLTHRGRS